MPEAEPRVFVYVIATVGPNYQLNGCVPWVTHGRIFFGPCKKRMRPEVQPADYIMGISRAGLGKNRRVLLWMRVAERMTFRDAFLRGEKNKLFRSARGHAIHVRPRKGVEYKAGNAASYEHITNAPHPKKWQRDIKGKRDVFLSGDNDSWVAAANGPQVNQELVDLIRKGVKWGKATVKNPLTQNARGKHVVLSGEDARKAISWVPRVKRPIRNSALTSHSVCVRECSCDEE